MNVDGLPSGHRPVCPLLSFASSTTVSVVTVFVLFEITARSRAAASDPHAARKTHTLITRRRSTRSPVGQHAPKWIFIDSSHTIKVTEVTGSLRNVGAAAVERRPRISSPSIAALYQLPGMITCYHRSCLILESRKPPSTGSFTSPEPLSRYSLSGGCYACTCCKTLAHALSVRRAPAIPPARPDRCFAYPVFPQAPGTLLGFLITSKVLGSLAVAANH